MRYEVQLLTESRGLAAIGWTPDGVSEGPGERLSHAVVDREGMPLSNVVAVAPLKQAERIADLLNADESYRLDDRRRIELQEARLTNLAG